MQIMTYPDWGLRSVSTSIVYHKIENGSYQQFDKNIFFNIHISFLSFKNIKNNNKKDNFSSFTY